VAVAALAAAFVLMLVTPAAAAVTGDYTASGVRIRSCPTTSCAILGLGYPGQHATIYCYKLGTVVNGSPYWYYNRDNATGVTGYSSDAYVIFYGSVSHC
jgi:uncharacterized protein YraI